MYDGINVFTGSTRSLYPKDDGQKKYLQEC